MQKRFKIIGMDINGNHIFKINDSKLNYRYVGFPFLMIFGFSRWDGYEKLFPYWGHIYPDDESKYQPLIDMTQFANYIKMYKEALKYRKLWVNGKIKRK